MARMRRRTRTNVAGEEPTDAEAGEEFQSNRFSTPASRADMFAAKSDNDAQTSLRLPGAMYEALIRSAKNHNVKLGEEIRKRIEFSFHKDIRAEDNETRLLLGAIASAATCGELPFGTWHQSPFAFHAFRAAILNLIDLFKPPGDPIRPAGNEAADFFLGEDGTPETASRILATSAALEAGIPLPGQRKRKREE